MYHKYMMVFSRNTNIVFIVALKIVGFYIIFFSIFKIISDNFGARIVILYLLFLNIKVRIIQLFREKLVR